LPAHHAAGGGARQAEDSVHVQLDHVVPVVVLEQHERDRLADRGVVHHHVDAAPRVLDLFARSRRRRRARAGRPDRQASPCARISANVASAPSALD
jgi:hypothetical protein